MKPAASTFDRVTAQRAIGFYAALALILRPGQPMRAGTSTTWPW
jgi:hypothetical protein